MCKFCETIKKTNWKKVCLWFWHYIILNLILKPILPTVSFGLAIYFAFIDKNAQMTIFIATGFVFILMFYASNLTKFFESIKIAGMDVKLRNEIKDSLKELKELTKAVSKISLDTVQSQRRLGHPDKIRQQEFYNEIDTILNNVNISNEEKIKLYNKYWHSWIIWDYFLNIKGLIRSKIGNNVGEFDKLYRDDKIHRKPEKHTASHLEEILVWAKNNTKEENWSEIETYISDFEHYLKNKDFLDFNRWRKLFKQEDN